MHVDEPVVINAPPATVFEHVSDPEKSKRWDEGLIELEMLTDGPFGLGTRIREVRKVPGGQNEAIEEVTTFEPGRKLGWTTLEGKFKTSGLISLEPQGEATALNFVVTGSGNFFMNPMSPLLSRAVSKEIRRNLQTLRGLIEA